MLLLQMSVIMLKPSHNAFCMCSFSLLALSWRVWDGQEGRSGCHSGKGSWGAHSLKARTKFPIAFRLCLQKRALYLVNASESQIRKMIVQLKKNIYK